MRLLYCYVKFLNDKGEDTSYRGLEKIEFNFSTVDRFSYDPLTNTLTRKKRKCQLPDNFWLNDPSGAEDTTNIYNINVISGENGSGKTTAIHYLIDLLDGLHAVADPAVKDQDHMETLGVAGNRTLLLIEEAGKQYLLDYTPARYESVQSLLSVSSTKHKLQVFRCTRRKNSIGEQDEGLKCFSALLNKTKVIYLTNTLSQHDYERNLGKQNSHLRDFFVYDVSLGSAIGSDIAQFFPYEVYKQVCYVFDEKQAKFREQIPELIMPRALRLCPRTELLKQLFPKEAPRQTGELPLLLGRLCAATFVENLRRLADFSYRPPSKRDLALPKGKKRFRKSLHPYLRMQKRSLSFHSIP